MDQGLLLEGNAPIFNLFYLVCISNKGINLKLLFALFLCPEIKFPSRKGEKLPGMRVNVQIAPHISQTSAIIIQTFLSKSEHMN